MEAILKKLHFVGQPRVLVMNAPPEMNRLTRALLDAGTSVETIPSGSYRWSIAFVRNLAEAEDLRALADRLIENDGILWVAYPKKTSKRYTTDIDHANAQELFEKSPVRFVAQIAIDEDWSALRLRRAEYVTVSG